jgi:mitochondrial import receptor subunit TOM22
MPQAAKKDVGASEDGIFRRLFGRASRRRREPRDNHITTPFSHHSNLSTQNTKIQQPSQNGQARGGSRRGLVRPPPQPSPQRQLTQPPSNAPQPGPKDDEDQWESDDGTTPRFPSHLPSHSNVCIGAESDISDVDSDLPADETLLDRLAALQDIVPPTYRKNLARMTSTATSWASSAAWLSGKTLWVLSTSALLLGVPWALAFSEEQQVQEMEREMRMQQSASQLLTQPAGGQGGQQQGAKPAL